MNFVIPMAGRGQRFLDKGFVEPKMLIRVHGKTLLEWSVDSLPLELCTVLIFVGLREHNDKYNIERFIINRYGNVVPSIRFVWIDAVTGGQAETALLGVEFADLSIPLVIYNIDTYFHSVTLCNDLVRTDIDGVIGSFRSDKENFSYALVDKNGFVVTTREKEVISNFALTGLYHFRKTSDFVKVAKHDIDNNIRNKNEFYIAPLYNLLISEGMKFVINVADFVWILGTPDELNFFRNEYH